MNPAEQYAKQQENPNFSYREATEDDIDKIDPATIEKQEDGSFMTPEGIYFKAGKDYTKEEPSVQVESGAKPTGVHETFDPAPSTATDSDELEAPVPAGQGAEPSKIDADPDQTAGGENTYSVDPTTENKGEDPTVLGETTAQLNPQEQYALQKKQTELRLVQEQLKPLDEATGWDKFQTGADATLQGMEQTIYDTMTGAGNALEMMTGVNIDASKLSKDNLLQIEILKAKLDSFSDSGDILTWQNLGGATPALLTLPIGIQSKLGMGLIEGVLAYAENRGLAKSVTESLMWGVGVGTGSMVVAHGIQVITERYGFGTLEKMLKTELDYTDSEAKQIYEEFAEATGKDKLNNDEKALALVSAGHERGAAFQQVVALDTKASTVMTRIADSKNTAIRGATVDKEVLTPYRELKAQSDFVTKKYAEFKEAIFQAKPNVKMASQHLLDLADMLDDLPDFERNNVVNKAIRKLRQAANTDLDGNPIGFGDISMRELFDVREALSKVTHGPAKPSKAKKTASDGKAFVDGFIEAQIPPEGKALWTELKHQMSDVYEHKVAMVGDKVKVIGSNVFGTILNKMNLKNAKGEAVYKPSQIIEELVAAARSKAPKGEGTMQSLHRVIGSEQMRELENGLVRELTEYNSKSPYNLNLEDVLRYMKHIEFVTPDGKALKKNLQFLEKVFSSDKYYKKVTGILKQEYAGADSGSITANLLSKLQYAAMNKFWRALSRLTPGENAGFSRKMGQLTRRIRSVDAAVAPLDKVMQAQAEKFDKVVLYSIRQALDAGIVNFRNAMNNRQQPPPPGGPTSGPAGPVSKRPKMPPPTKTPSGGYSAQGVKDTDFDYDTSFLTTGLPVVKPHVGVNAGGDIGSVTRFSHMSNDVSHSRTFYTKDRTTVKNWRDHKSGAIEAQGTHRVGHSPVTSPKEIDKVAGNHVENNMKLLDETRDRMSPAQQKLAEALIRDNPQTAAKYSGTEIISVGPYRGISDSGSNQMFVAGDARTASNQGTSTFLHEFIHQATVERYRQDPVFRHAIDSLYQHLMRADVDPTVRGYWKEKPEEFLAEAFGNQEVAEAMSKIPAPAELRAQYPKGVRGKIKSMWDAFTYTVAKGVQGKSKDSAYELLGDILADATTKTSGAGPHSPSSGNWGSTFMETASDTSAKTQVAAATAPRLTKKQAQQKKTQQAINLAAAKQQLKKRTPKPTVASMMTAGIEQGPKAPTKRQSAKAELSQLVKQRSTNGKALDEVLPKELQGNVHAIDVLDEAQDVLAKDKKHAQIMETKGTLQGVDNYIKPTYRPNPYYTMSLSKASVKRIREGKGTEADFEALKADIAAREHEAGEDTSSMFDYGIR